MKTKILNILLTAALILGYSGVSFANFRILMPQREVFEAAPKPEPAHIVKVWPPNGETTNTTASIQVTFDHAMDLASVQSRFKLEVLTALGWIEVKSAVVTQDNKTFYRIPSYGLNDEALYAVTIEKGSLDLNGGAVEEDYSSWFQTKNH